MTIERTLVIFKPDFLSNVVYSDDYLLENIHDGMYSVLHIIGLDVEIIKEDIKLTKVVRNMPRETAEAHYTEHKEKPFFEDLIKFITTGKCYIIVMKGNDAIQKMRTFVGLVRSGPYAKSKMENLMHASDSVISAEREITLHFGEHV